jgi:hypothetical protein
MKVFTFQLEEDLIRFTPDGKIAVIDAIQALCGTDRAETYWEEIVCENPEIMEYCKYHRFPGRRKTPVTDGRGWEKVETILFERVVAEKILETKE